MKVLLSSIINAKPKPCADGLKKLLDSLPAGATETTIEHILNNNGVKHAYWALNVIEDAADKVKITQILYRNFQEEQKALANSILLSHIDDPIEKQLKVNELILRKFLTFESS